MRATVASVSLLLLAGCAGNYTADKPGITNQQKITDLYQCANSTGEVVNVTQDANRPTGLQTDDPLLGAAVYECLKARGYTITAK